MLHTYLCLRVGKLAYECMRESGESNKTRRLSPVRVPLVNATVAPKIFNTIPCQALTAS